MKKHKCTFCGYIYNSDDGDAEAAIPAGTVFEDLPIDWTCPVCRMGKDKFVEIEISESGGCYETPSTEEQQIAPKNDSRIEEKVNNYNYDNH